MDDGIVRNVVKVLRILGRQGLWILADLPDRMKIMKYLMNTVCRAIG